MGNLTAKTSGEIASFMSPSVTNIKSLKVHFSPKQLGTGDPSPENVREIVGWDGVEVNGCGKNLAHVVGYSASTVNITQTRQISNKYGTTLSTVDFALPDTKLVVTQSQYPNTDTKHNYRNGYFLIIIDNLVFDKKYNISFKIDNITNNPLNATLKSIFLGRPSGSQTNPSEVDGNRLIFKNIPFNQKAGYPLQKYLEIRNCGMSFTLSEFMVTPVDDENFKYEPYQGKIDTTNWSSDVGTIYGGYVDLISGELVEEYNHVIVDFSTSWNSVSNYLYKNADYPPSIGGRDRYVKTLCSHLKNPYDITAAIAVGTAGVISVGKNFFSLANIEMTSDAFNQYLEEQNNNGTPLEICYLLKTPITHQLTPTQLSSFIGQNNFWSNADYVEVEYKLKETEDIQKARKKIILNQPHIESVKDDLVNFTTNMKAPLKECKVYFSPIQEGSGDLSPDNVRNIVGWDGVSTIRCGKNLVNVSDETRAYAYVGGSATKYTEDNNIIIISGTSNGGYQVSCKPNTQYTYSCEPTVRSGGVYLRVWELEEKYNGKEIPSGHLSVNQNVNSAAGSVATFTTKANTHYLVVGFYIYSTAVETGLTISDFQLELGDTRTSYEPYQGTTASINWTDEVGTVYGGYVDLVKGELVGNWIKRDLSEMSTINAPNSSLKEPWNHRFLIENWDYNNSGWDKINGTDNFIIDNITNDGNGKTNFTAVGIGNSPIIYIYDNTISTVEDFKTKYSGHYICYETKFPIHYQLTPQQLLTFKGTNNIWSNSNGQTEVKFWTY